MFGLLLGMSLMGGRFCPANAEEPAASLAIPAQSFILKPVGQAEASAWKITENGRIACAANFPAASNYTFIVIARGEPAAQVWPRMQVVIDGRVVFQTSVDSSEWTPYLFSEAMAKGPHEIAIGFINDFLKDSEDRNLVIADLSITAPSPASMPSVLTASEYKRLEETRLRQWNKDLDRAIEANRRGKLVVWVTGAKDNPIAQAEVQVEQTRHEFLFGTALSTSMFEPSATNAQARKYREMAAKLFNHAVTENAMKWSEMEPEQGQTNYAALDSMARWCASNQIPLRGHCLFWGCEVPDWSKSLSDEQLLQAMEQRISRVMSRYASFVSEFDALNEPVQAQAAQLVTHAARTDVVFFQGEHLRK